MSSQERTRFPITPREIHETAKSSRDVDARPEQHGRAGPPPRRRPPPPAGRDRAQPPGDDAEDDG